MANDRSSEIRENDIQDSNPPDVGDKSTEDTRRASIPSSTSTSSAEAVVAAAAVPVSRKEESSFSFKHFLRNSGSGDSSSSATTSSNLNGSSSSSLAGVSKLSLRNSTSSSSPSTQPNLGARPKVPHYSLQQQHNGLADHQLQQQQQLPRMKRSPKFPSFDSHASLAEYSEEVSSNFVQRSHSNYEVETPSASSFGGSSLNMNSSRRSPVNHGLTGQRESSLCNSPSGGGGVGGTNRNTSDFQAALPDFVKDHMVLEQWYQTNPFRSGSDSNDLSGTSPTTMHQGDGIESDMDSLPRRRYQNSNLFDLAMGSGGGGGGSSTFRLATNSPTVPLDLPTSYDSGLNDRIPLDLPHHNRFGIDRLSNSSNNHNNNNNGSVSGGGDIPLDLTDRHRVNSRNDMMGQQQRDGDSPPPQVQADMIQTLPDFLSDGPIHSSGRMADVAQDLPQLDSPEENAAVNVISRLRLENDRLRHELDEARRLISDQGRQINDLERTCRNGEIQKNGTVLERNKMNQKIAQLTEEIGTLKMENESLREEGGAVGGNPSDSSRDGTAAAQRRPSQRMCQMLSMELKLAAGSAEANLRQLLVGVENLKMLARRVEDGMDCSDQDALDDYLSDGIDDEDYMGGGGSGSAAAGGAGGL